MSLLEDLRAIISPKFSSEDLMKIVENYTASDLKSIGIDDIMLAPSSQKIGDSYLSKVIRFEVKATGISQRTGEKASVSINVITKILPPNLGRRKTFRSVDFFENEAIFYDKVWPSIEKFYVSKGLNQEFGGTIPQFLSHYIDGQNDFICLEDLSYKNYDSVERANGVNHYYTMKVIDLFAKFHSLSLGFKDQQPAEFSEIASLLKETYFSRKFYSSYSKLQESLFRVVRDAVRKELPQKYYDKIDKVLNKDMYNKACDICERNHCHLSGVTHGDAWIPNFLFRADNNDLQATLIDFQLARWAPFCIDLCFFLFTCVEVDILENHWDELINEYATNMKKYLGLLGSSPDIFDVEEFKEDIKTNIVCHLAIIIEALPMSLVDGFDLDLIEGDDAVPLESVWIIHPFEDQFKRRRIAAVIKIIVDKEFI